MDLKAKFYVEIMLNNGKNEQGTHSTKMGANDLAENTPKCSRNHLPNLSDQAKKFWISMKKGFIGRPQSVLETKRKS